MHVFHFSSCYLVVVLVGQMEAKRVLISRHQQPSPKYTRGDRERANESLKHFYNKWVVYFCVPCSKIPICRGEKESRYVERGSLYFMFTGNGHRQKTRFRSFVRSFFFCSFFSRSVCVCRFSRVRLIHALFYTPTVGLHSFKMLVCAAYEWDLPLHI